MYCDICKRIEHKQGVCKVTKGHDATATAKPAMWVFEAGHGGMAREDTEPVQGQTRGRSGCSRSQQRYPSGQMRALSQVKDPEDPEDTQSKGAEEALAIVEGPTPIIAVPASEGTQ